MRLLLPLLLMLLSACQALPPMPAWQSPAGRGHADLGVIRDLRSGERLSPEELVERLADAERLLVGERHDNPDHHALQLWLLEALAARREPGALLLEMLDAAQQARVDAVQTAARLPADLPAALAWQPGWDWALYGPILRHALTEGVPLRAANLSRDELLAVYRQPPALPAGAATAPAVRERLLTQLRQAHCGKLPDSQLPAMLAVQQQRDRRMAEALLAAPAPSLLLAGAYHVRRDLGVPLHLADLGAGAGTRVLQLAEVGAAVTAAQADFVWYTPAVPEQDHCARIGG
ncbi:ChaN family lipoprotein [Pseudomonas benzenivorans]|uniref:ChaN family lipoprotein n=1 Tax=Pseudomonas benzenivorans TaxID=556533 RepID=A0ABZ0PXF9_9PSED|nr:ChaN family lipoprotein [Pseudomonas benzenivorans]WPC05877.1 ChaN family lipoprotein [Pseudomonas benzenivorans]